MKNHLKGFSLIEIMVATILLGAMAVLLYSTINNSIFVKDNTEEISKRHQMIRQSLSRISREISMAYLSKHIYRPEPAFSTAFKGYHDKIYFSAFGNVIRQKNQKQSDLQVLGYYVAQDKEGNTSLIRRHHPNLNLDVEKGGGFSQVILKDVSKLEIFYFDDRYNKWEEEWFSDPSSIGDYKNKVEEQPKLWRLPSLIKIVLTVKMPGDIEKKWITAAKVVVQKPLDLN